MTVNQNVSIACIGGYYKIMDAPQDPPSLEEADHYLPWYKRFISKLSKSKDPVTQHEVRKKYVVSSKTRVDMSLLSSTEEIAKFYSKLRRRETIEKVWAIRSAYFCNKITSLSYVPILLDHYQTYYLRKVISNGMQYYNFISPREREILEPAISDTCDPMIIRLISMDPSGRGSVISSKSDIDVSFQNLLKDVKIDPETITSMKKILKYFLSDSSSKIIGISFLTSDNKERMEIWKKSF